MLALNKMYFVFLRYWIDQDHLKSASSQNYRSNIVVRLVFNF